MSEQDTATAPTAEAPAPQVEAATPKVEPKPEPEAAKPEPDWQAAYKGLQRTVNKAHQTIADLRQQVETQTGAIRGDMDVLLKQQLGEDAYKERVTERAKDLERQQAIAGAQAAQQFVAQSIAVQADTMRAAGVPEADIANVFRSAAETSNAQEWAAAVSAGARAALDRTRAQQATKATQAEAKTQEQIRAEAEALAERTLRAKGIDKVDLGQGTGAPRDLSSRIKSLDRNTEDGERQYQQLLKDAKAGRLGR